MDQSGIGIMMNSDKPGWNDSMNGLPGLFGSGTSETIELKRIVLLLKEAVKIDVSIKIPGELYEFYLRYRGALNKYLKGDLDDLGLFEAAQKSKETFNEIVAYNVSGIYKTIEVSSFGGFLDNALEKINSAINKAIEIGNGIIPSYLIHEAVEFDIIEGKLHPINGMQNVDVKRWRMKTLPLYLEAPARYIKQVHDVKTAGNLFELIKGSGLYDRKLKMYVTSESLEKESHEIGRARAFSAGWLERESVFMHMEYKYLFGILKSGLYKEFYEEIKTALPPFMNPAVYGRSTLENSSFIASSRNPDPSNHGRGFVSRLTGTTAEMVSIWLLMMTGHRLFKVEDGRLVFSLNPILNAGFFDENNEVRCRIFKDTTIKYINDSGKDTYGEDSAVVKTYILHYHSDRIEQLEEVSGEYAEDVRSGNVSLIEAILG
jgi:hypothetical protein